MSDQDIIKWILSEHLASNEFAAAHIANGLHLTDILHDPDAQKARVRLYRDWRASKIFHAKDTMSCYAKAILGESVPQEPMFSGVLHSEETE